MRSAGVFCLTLILLATFSSFAYARYFDPQTGRYLTPDPVGLAGGINPYTYTNNNPINMVDPEGLSPSFDKNQDGIIDKDSELSGVCEEFPSPGPAITAEDLMLMTTPLLLGMPPMPPKFSKRAPVVKVNLPTKGKIRYIPPKNWHPSEPLPRGNRGGFMDKFNNEWTKGPSRTQGQPFEWDVQRPDGTHWNISLDGKVTH